MTNSRINSIKNSRFIQSGSPNVETPEFSNFFGSSVKGFKFSTLLSTNFTDLPPNIQTFLNTTECRKRECFCENGQVDSSNCIKHNTTSCQTSGCDLGYYYDSGNKKCTIKHCVCDYGEKSVGKECSNLGDQGCSSCNEGYHLESKDSSMAAYQYVKLCKLNQCKCGFGGSFSKFLQSGVSAISSINSLEAISSDYRDGTEGVACKIHDSISCQPDNFYKEYCFQSCLDSFVVEKSKFLELTDYLISCNGFNLDADEIKECYKRVYNVCNFKCYYYGQLEMDVRDFTASARFFLGFVEIMGINAANKVQSIFVLNPNISFDWEVSKLVSESNTIFSENRLAFETNYFRPVDNETDNSNVEVILTADDVPFCDSFHKLTGLVWFSTAVGWLTVAAEILMVYFYYFEIQSRISWALEQEGPYDRYFMNTIEKLWKVPVAIVVFVIRKIFNTLLQLKI